jgi:hypothetical protein
MWTYEITTGSMYRPDGSLLAIGYSGGWGGLSQDKNNPDAENVVGEGPIPEGLWTFGNLFMDLEVGCPNVLRLTPDPATDLKGRSAAGFLIHGDGKNDAGFASKGCIILPPEARIEMGKSSDHQLNVIAIISHP